MEADLQRFYGIDYRDRWRRPDFLTFRRLSVLIRHLPPESAVAQIERGGKAHWTVEAELLDDLRILWSSTDKERAKRHPDRPSAAHARRSGNDPARTRRLAAARSRAAERRRAKEAGELT